MTVLSDLMTLSGEALDEFAEEDQELEDIKSTGIIGDFLDRVNELINERLDTSDLGVELPTLLFVISSSDEAKIQGICRNLRRADKYLLEAARLRMYTTTSKIAICILEKLAELCNSIRISLKIGTSMNYQ